MPFYDLAQFYDPFLIVLRTLFNVAPSELVGTFQVIKKSHNIPYPILFFAVIFGTGLGIIFTGSMMAIHYIHAVRMDRQQN